MWKAIVLDVSALWGPMALAMAVASLASKPACVSTCITKRSNEATRRDYIFCSSAALTLVRGLHVRAGDLCPTHSTVEVHLALDAPAFSMNKQRQITSLDHLVQSAFKHLYGEPPAPLDSDDILLKSWTMANPDDAAPTSFILKTLKDDYRYLLRA